MSKSRLEKFLYALYSLDSSDLPKPLSRIEELYSCLVTGDEVPTFEPLSRVEKYLMAILGGYDVDSLPNPISRVEVLLYKLAIGDDNLDDVKSFLSEHEELLAEIIRNGGVGGNIDIEYVLYTLSTRYDTLYNTAEKPVKSAILKGRTLVNLIPNTTISWACANSSAWLYKYVELNQQLKPNTIYTIIANVLETNGDGTVSLTMGGKTGAAFQTKNVGIKKGRNVFTAETYSDGQGNLNFVFFQIQDNYVGNFTLNDFIILEGDHSNEDIPYFEGMKSVQMPVLTTTGKNLFDGKMELGSITKKGIPEDSVNCLRSVNFIKIKPSTLYTITNDLGYTIALYEYDSDFNFIKNTTYNNTYTTLENTAYIKIKTSASKVETDLSVKFQIEEGCVGTSYEPYKSNILTVNEDVTLRGIGNVKDELDCLTGEVVQRVGEIILNGVENWGVDKEFTNTYRFYLTINDMTNRHWRDVISNPPFAQSNTFRSLDLRTEAHDLDMEHLTGWDYAKIILNISKKKLSEFSVDALKTYIQENPITIQYVLQTESVETVVDISVVDKDGKNTKLKTFNDITHVTLSSEGLIPEAELEVATKNEEDLGDSIVYTAHTLSEEHNTLYNTAKKPVKSAILKGNTLVNLCNASNRSETLTSRSRIFYCKIPYTIKANSVYTFFAKISNSTTSGNINLQYTHPDGTYSYPKIMDASTNGVVNLNIVNAKDIINIIIYISNMDTGQVTVSDVMIIEGDYTNVNVPYFKGMQSVKMPVLKTTGKNLFDVNSLKEVSPMIKNYKIHGSTVSGTPTEIFVGLGTAYIPVKKGEPYTVSCKIISNTNASVEIRHYNDMSNTEINNALHTETTNSIKTIYPLGNILKITLSNGDKKEYTEISDIQIEEGLVTTYEPYKSNILTTQQDLELRGVGDVRDELDLLTGEVIQRVGESNSENFVDCDYVMSLFDGYYSVIIYLNNKDSLSPIMSNLVPTQEFTDGLDCGIYNNPENIVLFKKGATLEEIKNLVSNLVIQYQLAEESVKTVDLSVVDQDGDNTKLSTFDDITHVTLSSEGLIPEAELEVAEKVTEVAASMLAISREQEVINTAANEQSENTDATMVAATEIYEELL